MWQRFGNSGASAPLMRLTFAMAMSSGALGFLVAGPEAISSRQQQQQQSYDRLLTQTFEYLGGRTVSKCEEEEEKEQATAGTTTKEVESYHKMSLPERGQYDGHAIFGVLLGENMIESYDFYRRPDGSDEGNVIVAHVQLGHRMDGHPGVVHGGILSLIFDDALGFGCEAIGVDNAVTANLNIDFRAPVLAGTQVRVAAQLEHREGRKLFWKAQMTSMDGETLYAEASSLYIIPRSS